MLCRPISVQHDNDKVLNAILRTLPPPADQRGRGSVARTESQPKPTKDAHSAE